MHACNPAAVVVETRQEDEKFKATLSDKLVKASMRYMRSSCLPETRKPKKKKKATKRVGDPIH